MSNSLDFRTQMNLVLVELRKKMGRKWYIHAGHISLRGGALNAVMEAKHRSGVRAREYFQERHIFAAKRPFSYADIFEGKFGYSRNYVDRKCGLDGFKTKFWAQYRQVRGRAVQRNLKEYYNFLQMPRDYNPDNRTMVQQEICKVKAWIMYYWLITKYWGRNHDNIPDYLTTVNNAMDWVQFHYNKDYLDKVWNESLMFKDAEFLAWLFREKEEFRGWGQSDTNFVKNLQDAWDFACSFGEGKKYDLTQIMGTKENTRAEVKALWDTTMPGDRNFDLRNDED